MEKKAHEENYFTRLYDINVNERTERKNGLTYLSWAWAWAEAKKQHPDAFYTVYECANPVTGYTLNYFTDGRTCWVKTGVTINGIEHIEYLPVMDMRNKSLPLESVTSFDVNKAIQRSLTKACARHGLGLYIYAGEDLPECEGEEKQEDPFASDSEKEVLMQTWCGAGGTPDQLYQFVQAKCGCKWEALTRFAAQSVKMALMERAKKQEQK